MAARKTTKALTLTVEDGLMRIVLDVPGEAQNTLISKLAAELEELFTRLDSDKSIRAAVFSSGNSSGTTIRGCHHDRTATGGGFDAVLVLDVIAEFLGLLESQPSNSVANFFQIRRDF